MPINGIAPVARQHESVGIGWSLPCGWPLADAYRSSRGTRAEDVVERQSFIPARNGPVRNVRVADTDFHGIEGKITHPMGRRFPNRHAPQCHPLPSQPFVDTER